MGYTMEVTGKGLEFSTMIDGNLYRQWYQGYPVEQAKELFFRSVEEEKSKYFYEEKGE